MIVNKGKLFLIISGLVLFLLGYSFSSFSANYNLKLGHDMPIDHPYHTTAQYFADQVKEATNGEVEIEIFPAGALGDELTMLESVQLGDLDFSLAAAPNAASFAPKLGLYSVSYLFKNQEHFLKAVEDENVNKLTSKIFEEQNLGIRFLGMFCAGTRSVYNSLKPIYTIEDIKGLKIRVMASPIETKVWRTVGALPTSIPYGEVYTAIQTGIVDAAENGPTSYYAVKHYEVAPYFSLTEHQFLVSVLVANEDRLESLPKDIKNKIIDIGFSTGSYGTQSFFAAEKEVINKEFKEEGIKINEVDKKGFINKLAPLQDEVAKDFSIEDLLDRIRSLSK